MDAAFEVLKSGHGLLRDLPGVRVWGVDDGALVLALVLSERLGLNVLRDSGPGVIELHGVVTHQRPGTMAAPDAEVWAWVDATSNQQVQSVVKATAGTRVVMPWQDAGAACRRVFVPGFDD